MFYQASEGPEKPEEEGKPYFICDLGHYEVWGWIRRVVMADFSPSVIPGTPSPSGTLAHIRTITGSLP